MAPSAVETATEPAPVTQEIANKPLPFKLHLTPYKEIDTTRLDRAVEEGKTGLPAAKVHNSNPEPCPHVQCLTMTTVPKLPPYLEPGAEVPPSRGFRAL